MNQLTGGRSLGLGTWPHRLAAVLFFATLGLIGVPTASAAVIDHVTWNGNDYYLISENTATGAEIEAQSLGGHLATITSQEEHDFLWATWRNSLGTGLGLWIGLTDDAAENDFVWMSGEPVTFTNWNQQATPVLGAPLEPSNGRLKAHDVDGNWFLYGVSRYEEDFVVMDSRSSGRWNGTRWTQNGEWNDVPDAGPGWRPARGIVKVSRPTVEPVELPQGPGYASEANNRLDPHHFSTGNEVTVATLNLPAGNYVLDAKVLVGNRSTSPEQVTCSLLRFGERVLTDSCYRGTCATESSRGVIDIADARLFGGAPFTAGSYATLPLAGSINLSSSETIEMICATTSTDAFAQYPKLNAVKVETLN